MEYYSAKKMKVLLTMIKIYYKNSIKIYIEKTKFLKMKFAGKWIELETNILSEVTWTQRQMSHVLPHSWMQALKS